MGELVGEFMDEFIYRSKETDNNTEID